MKSFAKYTWFLVVLTIIPVIYRTYLDEQQPPAKWSIGGLKLGISRAAAGTALPNRVTRTIPIDDDHYFTTICHTSGNCVAFQDAAAVSVVGHSLESDGNLLLRQGDRLGLIQRRMGQPDTTDDEVLIYRSDVEVRVVLADGKLKWVQLGTLPNEIGDLHWMAHDHFSLQEAGQPEFDPERTQLIINTTYPAKEFRVTGISEEGKLLINCQGENATPRERVHEILGTPRVANESESIWMYKNITDVNRDWKPHAQMEVLVIRFDQNGLAKDVETDLNTLMNIAEELKITPTTGD